MKLLLCKSVDHLGIVGDVVDVSVGYARNYLVPHGLATEPTQSNMRRLAEARKQAELEHIRQRDILQAVAERLKGVEVTIHARANEEGVLYGSVGKPEIAAALSAEGFPIKSEHVVLDAHIKHLDNVTVDIRLAADLRAQVKVWVVREKIEGEEASDLSEEGDAGMEAESGDDRSNN